MTLDASISAFISPHLRADALDGVEELRALGVVALPVVQWALLLAEHEEGRVLPPHPGVEAVGQTLAGWEANHARDAVGPALTLVRHVVTCTNNQYHTLSLFLAKELVHPPQPPQSVQPPQLVHPSQPPPQHSVTLLGKEAWTSTTTCTTTTTCTSITTTTTTPCHSSWQRRLYSHHNHHKHNVQCLCTESTHKGVNQRSKYVTEVKQQRPESPTVTLSGMRVNTRYINSTKGTSSDTHVLIVFVRN